MNAVLDKARATQYKFRHYNAAGELVWASGLSESDLDLLVDEKVVKGSIEDLEVVLSQLWTPNELADEGEDDMLEVYFRAQTAPTSFYFSLWNDTPVDTDTIASLLNEVSGTGYARIAVARNTTDWGAVAPSGGDAQTTTATKTFTAGGTWTAATQLVLVTASSGTAGLHIAWAALSTTRTLVLNDTLQVSMAVKLA